MKNKPGRKKLPDNQKRPKIGITISKENYNNLREDNEMMSRVIDKLLTKYYKNKCEKI